MKRTISGVGVALGIVFILIGILTKVPDRSIGYFDPKEYVGGDAYNYIIEAGIRGGEISGTSTSKAIYIVGGSIICFISLMNLTEKDKFKEENNIEIKSNIED